MLNLKKKASKKKMVRNDLSKESIGRSFKYNLTCTLAKDKYTATKRDDFTALAITIRDRLVKRWIATQECYHNENKKRVYYLSLEFLIGRLLSNNILNIGVWKQAKKALEDLKLDIEDLREQELDAGLGNGGLGRLAACFLDSMATIGIPAHGYGIKYEYGIFNQKIIDGYQVERPDEWLKFGNPWEFARPEYAVKVKFYGNVEQHKDKNGDPLTQWVNSRDVLAVPFDIPVPGYNNGIVNTLRLWSAKSTEEFDFDYFNHGDYEEAVTNRIFSENISKVLYPNDNVSQGRELRLKQEYFFTAASISDILRRFKQENSDLKKLPDKVAIQLNDTHPTLAILELMRILMDTEKLDWESALDIVVRVFAYTNHTVMPEALEHWSVERFENLLPRHMQIVYEMNQRFLNEVSKKFPNDSERLQRMSIIQESERKQIRMAHICIAASHSINGVSELHTNLLKNKLFKDFYEMFPERFNNKTNGITQRRWLLKANKRLSDLISENIGDKWTTDLYDLKRLLPFKDNAAFIKKWQQVKLENKRSLSDYVRKNNSVLINPNSLFDVHIKRIHEYKRQLLFTFYAISQYLKVKNDPNVTFLPRTFISAGKAAPGYFMAKLIIKFMNNAAGIINNDKTVSEKMKFVFLENYRVSLAEKIFPASDLSEQIATAGTEASGTGCMKFMINSTLTIGTYDGANIEMSEEVGPENIFIFGLKADEVMLLRERGYHPKEYIERSKMLKEIIHLIETDFFSPHEKGIFQPIVQSLVSEDPYFICADFDLYIAKQEEASNLYRNYTEWTKKAIINVANSGKFSSDRTIKEYARDIWGVGISG